jgi:dUTP pyrophosphatase
LKRICLTQRLGTNRGYRREVEVILANLRDAAFLIARSDRTAKLVRIPVQRASLEELLVLDDTARGAGGTR